MRTVYRCEKCNFEYKFPPGAFKGYDKAVVKEIKRCPGCGNIMKGKKE